MIRDILLSVYLPRDSSVLRAEIRHDHRNRSRMFLLRFITRGSVGAELGVFTGLFSSILAHRTDAAHITFVDPWWTLYGDYYPDWGAYTDFGRLKTRAAYAAAQHRVLRHITQKRCLEVTSSVEWLAGQADESLDWVYLDTTHSYEGTKQELELLKRKVKDGGFILGDDWYEEEDHMHHGVWIAVNEFLRDNNFQVVFCGRECQWALRKSAAS